ncbi:protein of unknown function (plasmid) [Azospirillum lipoferum 4B]|uniref:Uncharacterized protein n=1 Tax=Azospirillum lipoferum (strain 4B) TaxID=862719 RepID=G7ZGS5_AZOL4|nr:protein of unknown function [Azospirillum lipoferum 4B]
MTPWIPIMAIEPGTGWTAEGRKALPIYALCHSWIASPWPEVGLMRGTIHVRGFVQAGALLPAPGQTRNRRRPNRFPDKNDDLSRNGFSVPKHC